MWKTNEIKNPITRKKHNTEGIPSFQYFHTELKEGGNSAIKYDQDFEATYGLAVTDFKPDIAKTGAYNINVKRAVMIKKINIFFSKWIRLRPVF